MFDEKRFVFEAITRYNYFPNQKASIGEVPPIYSSRTFTPEVSNKLASIVDSQERRHSGYDLVEYFATRHNNVPRTLSVIHPVPYSRIARLMHENWEELRHVCFNEVSMIKPDVHQDGRMLVMNYEGPEKKIIRELGDGFGCKFRVNTDISGCFNGIYSHAIEWAVVGMDAAKQRIANRGGRTWSADLDQLQSHSKRKETQGIPIGPATSSVIVELILGKVDQRLIEAGFRFRRHIDDYVCYCEGREQAEQFLRVLGTALRDFKLHLNLHKTSISELPSTLNDDWITRINAALPQRFVTASHETRTLLLHEVIQFLDFAVQLNKRTPDASVLKYAISSTIHAIDESAFSAVFDYILNLSWHYPILLPYLDVLLGKDTLDPISYESQLNQIISVNAVSGRSDGMAWGLYYLKKYGLALHEEVARKVVATRDCFGLLGVYFLGSYRGQIAEIAQQIIGLHNYERDRYWLLLYQLYLDNVIPNPYGDDSFPLLKENEVNFVIEKNHALTRAERYAQYLVNPFRAADEAIVSFDAWRG